MLMRVLLGGLSASGEIAQVGTMSANGDPKIGRTIAQAGQQWVSPGGSSTTCRGPANDTKGSETIGMAKNTICLWYYKDAEAAARFYAETFPGSAVGAGLLRHGQRAL